jgi:N-glycosylase/DNA lyase
MRAARLAVEELRCLHAERELPIQSRLEEFRSVPHDHYLYELLYCLLTPQSSAVNAGHAIDRLRALEFHRSDVDPEPILRRKESYIRFHRVKAKRLIAAKEQFPLIDRELRSGVGSRELRAWLVRYVVGLGWKEASHFLRNIGHRDLAILDRHILRNLVRVGAVRSVPGTLSAKRYAAIEKKFLTFASVVGIPMDELDLLFWSMETGEILK